MNPTDTVHQSAPESAPRSVLIVDDEEPLLRLMVRLLERAGYQVWAAKDGTEARALFREHAAEIDLAFIDVMHPPDAGAEDLLPELLEQKPGLDVILTSGDVLSPSLEEILNRIGGGFLRKPFASKALLRILDEMGGNQVSGSKATGRAAGRRVV
ncbi:MAG: response regulator [Myxococcales bacterium]|nr:response regulator [Myxococcales bacterium]HIK84380.1 response regulator [Myxococcales bacterium]